MSQVSPKRVILLNGPPSSGKDLSAIILRNMLHNQLNRKLDVMRPEIMKFADPLKQAAHVLLGIPYSCEYYEKKHGNKWKDEPQIEFYGKTPRSEYIALSEEFAKVRHGSSVFGRVLARRIQLSNERTFIIPDSGFVDEAIPVTSAVGIDNILLIELTRPGTSFDGDSRGYIGDELSSRFAGKLRRFKLPNNSDQKWLTTLLKGVAAEFLDMEVTF
jgi:hypothetical protein